MKSHNLELSLQINHFDSKGKLKNSYLYPYEDPSVNKVDFTVSADGETIQKKTIPVRSFVSNYLKVFSNAWAKNTETLTTTTGGSVSPAGLQGIFLMNAAANDNTFGVWVATGSVTHTITSSQYVNKVQHGSGSGQLIHGVSTFVAPTNIGGTHRLIVKRNFTNNSGGTITVTGSGIAIKTTNGTIYMTLIDNKDETDNTISIEILNGQTLTAEYHFDISSAGYYLSNFLNAQYSAYSSGSVMIKTSTFDTVGSQSVSFFDHDHWRIDAGANIDTWGILIGSSSVSKSMNDYRLFGQYQQGSGSNQVVHGTTEGDPIVINNPNGQFSVKRTFDNLSGVSLSVAEAAIYLHGAPFVGGNPVNTQDNQKTCIVRTSFTPFSVDNNESVQLTFNAKIVN